MDMDIGNGYTWYGGVVNYCPMTSNELVLGTRDAYDIKIYPYIYCVWHLPPACLFESTSPSSVFALLVNLLLHYLHH
ncbi:hypothetical protein EYC80_000255 [Monilinia laxa]|uniref:Uncharacterized protein n=1 Tax=Monilinia laxa TaxID=61186 RepID=A0A5N6KA24_MONLA|nr:hypothetical protein EYC80_000255 [Monilinia laxa]